MNELRMLQKIVRQILLVLCLFLSYNGVQGRKKLSELEDMELEKQLKLLNKPVIKTVKVLFSWFIYNICKSHKTFIIFI